MKIKFVCRAVLALALFVPLLSSAATLRATSSVGDSAAEVPTCGLGATLGAYSVCSNDSGELPATPLTTAYSASSATYPSGDTSQTWASGTLGTLHGFGQSNIPSADAAGHNLQSHAQVEMKDSVLASSSYGTLYNNYQYTIDFSGFATADSPYGSAPSTTAFGAVILDIRNPTCTPCYVNKTLDLSSATPNGILTGTLSAPLGEELDLDLFLQVNTQVGTNAVGQSAFAQIDYSNTVHFYLDALTPGANTVGTSGYDYASPAAVPLPASAWMFGSGLLGLAGMARKRKVT